MCYLLVIIFFIIWLIDKYVLCLDYIIGIIIIFIRCDWNIVMEILLSLKVKERKVIMGEE